MLKELENSEVTLKIVTKTIITEILEQNGGYCFGCKFTWNV